MTNHANAMDAMPGNPFYGLARESFRASWKDDTSRHLQSAQAEATLALAFEQRTANLIAAAQIADDETADRLWVDHITPRLGLDGGDDDD